MAENEKLNGTFMFNFTKRKPLHNTAIELRVSVNYEKLSMVYSLVRVMHGPIIANN